ncbi:MAG: kynureninase [Pseudomonadota bacterium]
MTQLPMKHAFEMPEGVIYLDGNSLGPLPKGVADRVSRVVRDEWGQHLIRGWNVDDWMGQPKSVGNRVGRLIGATPGSTVLGDTLSIKVYQALASAIAMRPGRRVIVSETGNFPTDLYMAQGLIRQLGRGHELRLVEPEGVEDALSDDVAAVMLTHVDYRTGRMHDLNAITSAVQSAGAVMIWDLAHSAGALPVDIEGSGAEFAVGCTYKYINAGPGAPAFITVRPDIVSDIEPALAGWLGHEAPFAFDPDYRPAGDIERFRVGTPPVLQVAALDAALDIWDQVTMDAIRAASVSLCEQFIEEVEARVHDLTLASPRIAAQRGSQVSFRFEHGYAAMQALISRGVIGDFRAPNIMRFGFCPLFLDASDVSAAVDHLAEVMDKELWKQPEFQKKSRVT